MINDEGPQLLTRVTSSPFWQAFGGSYALSGFVIGFVSALAFLGTIWNPLLIGIYPLTLILFTGLILAGITALLALIARSLFLPGVERSRRPFIALVIYTALTAVVYAGQDTANALLGREIFGVISRNPALQGASALIVTLVIPTLLIVVSTNAVATFQSQQARQIVFVRDLSTKRQQLEALRNSYEVRIEEIRHELNKTVREKIDPVIKELDEQLRKINDHDADVQEIRLSLLIAIDDVIRPLSKELAEPTAHEWSPPEEAVRDEDALPRNEYADVRILINPAPATLMITFITAVGLLTTDATVWQYPIRLFCCVAAMPLLIAVVRFLPASWAIMRRIPAILVASTILIVYFYLGRLIYQFAIGFFPTETFSELSSFRPLVLIVPTSLILTSASASRSNLQRLAQEISQVNIALELLIAQLRIANWAERRQLSLQLHGPLQSTLLAAAIILNSSDVVEEHVNQARQVLAETASRVGSINASDVSLHRAIDGIIQTWRHSCRITLDVASQVENYIDSRPGTMMYVIEIIREAISNGVRHGGASQMSVRIVDPETDHIEIEVRDNGQRPLGLTKPGLGTALLSETAMWWELSREFDETRLIVAIPYVDEDQLDVEGHPTDTHSGILGSLFEQELTTLARRVSTASSENE